MKKTLLTLSLVLSLIVACLVGCEPASSSDDLDAKKASAAAVFTIDVNPGIRVYVKSDDTVIAVEATNEDGEAVVSELEIADMNYEAVVEEVIDKMEEKGFLEGEESSVLISVEKKEMEVSEKLHEKIEKTFEKHGKRASVIEQELDALDKEIEKAIGDMAKKYNISEGKAHLIEKIREEFPELSEDELAELKVNDLGMMLEETSDDIKEHFKKLGPAVEENYIGREQALANAIESLEAAIEDVTMQRVRVTRADGKMVYEAEFVYNGMEYEITVDAVSGEILETESEEFEEFDPKDFIDDYCNKNECDMDAIKDQIIDEAFGKDGYKNGSNNNLGKGAAEEPGDEYAEVPENEYHEENNAEKPLSRGEIFKKVISDLGISEKALKKTDARLYEAENGAVYSVTVETETGDVYKLVVEAYVGAVLKVELNGAELEMGAEIAE